MTFSLLTENDELWEEVVRYAAGCSWRAGSALASAMESGVFSEWERVIAAHEDGQICGFCTVAEKDCIPNLPYTPYIGYVFVDENCRGKRLSGQMIRFAMDYLKQLGFCRVYLISDHENLYEKYGFSVVDRAASPWGSVEKIYRQAL